MNTLIAQPAFQMYALCSVALVVILYTLGFMTAKKRADKKLVINHEDVKINPGSSPTDVEPVEVQRLKRAHLNSLENAVPFFAMGFLYSQTAPNMTMANILFFGFVGLRTLHAIFYLTAKQPFRTLCFALGAIVNITMAVQIVRAVIALM